MPETLNVKTAELAVGKSGEIITTGSIGSCIVVALYDRENHVGGMVHAMLPSRHSSETDDFSARYVDEGIHALISEIEKQGGNKRNLEAKLIGGAKMFKHLTGDDKGIGYKNTEAAKELLEKEHIRITGDETGGSTGRIATLTLSNGLVSVETKL